MGKSKDKGSNKAAKKKPQKSIKEKRAAKVAKRSGGGSA
jgi:hypothetical protein